MRGCLQPLPAGAAGRSDLLGARGFEPLPFTVAVGPVGVALPGLVDPPPGEVAADAWIQSSGCLLEGVQHHADAPFAVVVAGQPVLHERGRGQIGEAARDGPGVEAACHPAHRRGVLPGRRAGADRPVRVRGRRQPRGQVRGHLLVRQIVQAAAVEDAIGQAEQHRQGLLDLGGHQIPSSNSAAAASSMAGAPPAAV
jgi:hypothetical protein